MKRIQRIALIFGMLTLFEIACGIIHAQNPQTQTAPLYAVNAKYVNGIAPGYYPSAGTGLSVILGPGTVNCSGTIIPYGGSGGGGLSLTASTTNYVYLNTSASCAPAVKTTTFTSSDIPIAAVVTSGSAVTSITDDRTMFNVPASGGGFTAGGDLSGSSTSQTVIGLDGTPFCDGYAPTNSQAVTLTTAGSPNPCYTAAITAAGDLATTSVSDNTNYYLALWTNNADVYQGGVVASPTYNPSTGALTLPATSSVAVGNLFLGAGATYSTEVSSYGSQSGNVTLTMPPVATGSDTLVSDAATQTLTNKTLTSPTLTTPALGTPASGVITNLTGTCTSCTANAVTSITGIQLGTAASLPTDSIPYSAGTSSALTDVASPTVNGVYGIGWNVTGSAAVAPASFQLTGSGVSCTGSPLVCTVSGGGAGTVTTTGSPSSGQMAAFSSSTSITTATLAELCAIPSFACLAPSADTTGVTDNSNMVAAIATGKPIILLAGSFYFTGNISISAPPSIIGQGPGQTNFYLNSATHDLFDISYGAAGGLPGNESFGAIIRGFSVQPASGVTPTAGAIFNLSGTSSSAYLTGLRIEDIDIFGEYDGFYTGNYFITNWIDNIKCANFVSGGACIYYNSPLGSGDIHWNDIEATGAYTGVTIAQSDTQTFQGLKLNGAEILFTGAGPTTRVRFINLSLEGTGDTPPCEVDFGTGANAPDSIEFIGGGIGLAPQAFCNVSATAPQYAASDLSTYTADLTGAGTIAPAFYDTTPYKGVGIGGGQWLYGAGGVLYAINQPQYSGSSPINMLAANFIPSIYNFASSGSVALDLSKGGFEYTTATGTLTLTTATGVTAGGQILELGLCQGGTVHTISFNSSWIGAGAPTATSQCTSQMFFSSGGKMWALGPAIDENGNAIFGSFQLGTGTAMTSSVGNGGVAQETTSAAKTSGDLVAFDANGNTVDNGAALPSGTTATTQASTDNSTYVATDAFVKSLVGNNGPGTLVGVQVLTTGSGATYAPDSGTVSFTAILVGPGGGGGGTTYSSSSNWASGGGGGCGAVAAYTVTGIASGLTGTYTVSNTGGVGGANTGGTGSTAASTTFQWNGGTTVTAAHGSGGVGQIYGTSVIAIAGGAGGTSSNGTVNAAGGPGEQGYRASGTAGWSGNGCSQSWGGGGVGLTSDGVGNNGAGYGSGGGGAVSHSASYAGGNGGPGLIIVYEYGAGGPILNIVKSTSTPVSVSATQYAELYLNQNATPGTAMVFNLPTAAANVQKCFRNSQSSGTADTGTIEIWTSAAGQYIEYTDGTLSASGGGVTSGGAAGDAACVIGVDATHWVLYTEGGVWTKTAH